MKTTKVNERMENKKYCIRFKRNVFKCIEYFYDEATYEEKNICSSLDLNEHKHIKDIPKHTYTHIDTNLKILFMSSL